jgi:hypothetical protein
MNRPIFLRKDGRVLHIGDPNSVYLLEGQARAKMLTPISRLTQTVTEVTCSLELVHASFELIDTCFVVTDL